MFGFFKKKKRAMMSDTNQNWSEFGFSGPTSTGQNVTEQSAMMIPAVFACIRVLAESCGSLPLMVYERKPDGTKERARNFPLYKFLHDSPNSFMDAVSFWELLIGHCALRGNSYAFVDRDEDGTIQAIWPLLPQNMTIKVEKGVLVYEYLQDGKTTPYKWRDILHIKGLSFDGVVGLSPLSLLRETIGRAQAINEYSGKFFGNDARPGGILKHPSKLVPEAQKILAENWNDAFKGSGKSHKTAVLEEGMDYVSVGLSPEDSQMIDSQKFSVIDICRVFRVPLNLVMDYERSTYSNVTEQNRSFVVHTLVPWLTRIEQACNRVLFTENEKKKYFCEFKLDNLLRGDQKTRYECYQIGIDKGFLSRNDVRGFENLSPVPGGDDYGTSNEKENQTA
ncbi:MAG: phage portal protein [Proteobacteria bacterium]|nr:phage portal protein [Desulfobacula sp.]MBU4131222.1 phage portal protein [Pseudomonadota bacterium]